MICTI